MKPVNLYILSRLSDFDLQVFLSSEQIMSDKDNYSIIREHEKDNLRKFVENLNLYVSDISVFDNFYYSYSISQISEEFDLLKFKDNKILNIEIKNELIEKKDILYQLEKNRYYLGHLEKEIISLTYIASDNVFFINLDGDLQQIEIEDVVNVLQEFNTSFEIEIDDLFKASKFLVSPLNTPEKFLNNQYFLTNHQIEIKTQIYKLLNCQTNKYFQIKGIAGTGKTLLIYDIAKDLSKIGKTCIIHGGILCSGHAFINENSLIDIVSAKEAKNKDFSKYHYILIDESHRIYKSLYETLIKTGKKLIFSLDSNQILSKAEINRNIPGLILNLPNLSSFELTKKIRTNKEIAAFIIRMFDMSKRNQNINFKNIDLYYANDVDEAKIILGYLKTRDYKFINYTPSIYYGAKLDYFNCLSDVNTHEAIGQEYDNVAMFLDKSFYYDNNNLKSTSHPNPDYLYDKLFFQGVTRVREKLAIVILDNIEIYKNLLKILINKD